MSIMNSYIAMLVCVHAPDDKYSTKSNQVSDSVIFICDSFDTLMLKDVISAENKKVNSWVRLISHIINIIPRISHYSRFSLQ